MNESNEHREPNAQVILLLLLVVLVFAVPIRLILPAGGLEFRRGLTCGMELLFAVPYLLSLARRQTFVVLSPVGGTLFVGWMIAAAVSVALSPHWLPALARQFEWICHILFAVAIWHFLKDNRDYVRRVIAFATTGALFVVLIVVWTWINDADRGGVPFEHFMPLFSHIRIFGHYALAGVLLTQLWAADPKAGHARLIVPLSGLSVFWAALIWTGGRAAVASAVIGLAVIFWLSAERRRMLTSVNIAGLTVGSVIATLISAGAPAFGWSGVLGRMAGSSLNGFTTGRLEVWRVAYEHFLNRPLFGFGPDAHLYVLPRMWVHPHNVVLQFLTDYGVIGTVIFGLLMCVVVVAILRRVAEMGVDLRAERIVGVSVLLAFSGNAMLDGNFYHSTPLMIISLAVAIGLLPESHAVQTRGFPAIRPVFAGAMATITACFFALYIAVTSSFLVGSVPAPDGIRAQLVRHLPLATNSMALETWIRTWGTQDVELATEWAHWAHQHSSEAYRFSSLEAKLLAEQGLYKEARDHARLALESASRSTRMALSRSLQPIIESVQTNSEQLLFEIPGEGR